MSSSPWSGEGYGGGGEVRNLLGDRARREHNKQGRRTCCVSLVVLVAVLLFLALVVGVAVGTAAYLNRLPSDPDERAVALLEKYPLVDGHNDLPHQIRSTFNNSLELVDLNEHLSEWHTDIPRLRAGQVGAQFWSAYMPCSSQYKDATRTFIDQVDVIKRFVNKYPEAFTFATSAADIDSAYRSGKIASLIGVEGGHAIDSSFGTLRQFYDLGARYMTLTHTCNTPWAHNSYDTGDVGLTDFGRGIVEEMNRLGMMVDVSHVNEKTMMDAIETSRAPVIFSHSSAYAICAHPRNVPDNILESLRDNGGIIMITFVASFVNCEANATLSDVADHIDHVRKTAGIDHIGIGGDYDGTSNLPVGLEDVSKYPDLFAELIRRNYTDNDVAKISRKNLLRVFREVEKVSTEPDEPRDYLIQPQPEEECRPDF